MRVKQIAAILTLVANSAFAGLKIELPPETTRFIPGDNADLANAQCLICHSAEYVTTQPRLSLVAWKASITKMREKYGAPIPPDQIEPLAEYLTRHYGTPGTNKVGG